MQFAKAGKSRGAQGNYKIPDTIFQQNVALPTRHVERGQIMLYYHL